jgi:uncharacterized protein (TIGR00369 family)
MGCAGAKGKVDPRRPSAYAATGELKEHSMAGPIQVTDGAFAGYWTWPPHRLETFGTRLGPIYWRAAANGQVECCIETDSSHLNGNGALHGGFLMSFADMALYAAAAPSLVDFTAVTVTCNTEFLGAGEAGRPLVAQMELLKETGKMIFLRGMVSQDGRAVIAFSGTLRKVPRKRSAPADRQD